MRRLFSLLATVASFAFLSTPPPTFAAPSDFEGIWTGEITAPNTRTKLGLAFTPTPDGLLVSLHFPEMFLYTANFGAADIRDDTFTLAPLQLVLTRQPNDELVGTFAPGRLPVRLHRGGTFSAPPEPPTLPAAPAPRWQRPLGAPVWSSPVVGDGIVYVAATDGRVHALRAADGEPVWTWTGPHPFYGDALVTADALYLLDERSHLVALARADGQLLWRLDLHENDSPDTAPSSRNPTFNHRTAAPVIDARGILYVGSTDSHLYAINAESGRIVWRHPTPAPIYAPVALQGDNLVAACFDGTLFSLHRRNRRERFRTTLSGPLVSAPVLVRDRLVIGSRDYFLHGLDAANATARWRNTYWFSWVESTPRVADGVLYIGGSDFRRVSALDPRDGRQLWSTDVLGLSWGSPVVTADTVFAGTAGQDLPGTVITHRGGIVALDRQTGAIRWRHQTATPAGAPFNGIAGSLALVDDLIIAADVHGTVLALPQSADSP